MTAITKLEQTCPACPSQWEGTLEDGHVYIRYRFGVLSWGTGATIEEAVEKSWRNGRVLGGAWHGEMDTGEMLGHLREVFVVAPADQAIGE